MTVIVRHKVDRFRNLISVDLSPSPGFNLIFGKNGSGKTSLLESIHVLSVGRSFRTHKIAPLVNTEEYDLLVFSNLAGFEHGGIGLTKSRQGRTELRAFGESQKNWQYVAELLPLQVINTDSLALLEGPAKGRRRFLDWAMFHVEHSFLASWRAYRRAVTQRNALLRQIKETADRSSSREPVSQIEIWEKEVSIHGEIIHSGRKAFFESLRPVLKETLDKLMPGFDLDFEYKRGWDEDIGLLESMSQSRARDVRYGMTMSGPHRGDFTLTMPGRGNVSEVFSRGQLKLLVCSLKLAVGRLLYKSHSDNGLEQSDNCIYLVDDLAAELDRDNQEKVLSLLAATGAQCFLTSIDPGDLPDFRQICSSEPGKFHVEHGKIHPA
jgi:DNA replication and repair protein RecF